MTIPRKQIFAYLPKKHVIFLDQAQKDNEYKSRSATIEVMIEEACTLREPRIKQFLEMEAAKRGIDPKKLMVVAMDIVRDAMRGIRE